jgi:nicotinamidase-related amidase
MSALVLVDVQRNMLEGVGAVPDAEAMRARLAELLDRARGSGAAIVYVQNDGGEGDPDLPGTSGWELVFTPRPDELVVRKSEPDAFASASELRSDLRARGVSRLLLAGMQSEFCIAATARGGRANGFDVFLLSGAHTTFDQSRPASQIAAMIEAELVSEGIESVEWSEASL